MPDHKGDSGPCIMNSSKSAALPTVAKSGLYHLIPKNFLVKI